MNRVQNKKKAFTLVELIVVIALVGIIGAAAVSTMVPASNVFVQMAKDVQAKMKTNQVMQMVVEQIRFAGDLEILTNSSAIGVKTQNRYLYCRDGKVFLNEAGTETDLFTDNFYDGYAVTLAGTKLENNLMQVNCTVVLSSDNSINSELTTAVRALNTQNIAGLEGGIISYVWSQP